MLSDWVGGATLGRKVSKQVGQVYTPQNVHKACAKLPATFLPETQWSRECGALSLTLSAVSISSSPFPLAGGAKPDSGPGLPPCQVYSATQFWDGTQ